LHTWRPVVNLNYLYRSWVSIVTTIFMRFNWKAYQVCFQGIWYWCFIWTCAIIPQAYLEQPSDVNYDLRITWLTSCIFFKKYLFYCRCSLICIGWKFCTSKDFKTECGVTKKWVNTEGKRRIHRVHLHKKVIIPNRLRHNLNNISAWIHTAAFPYAFDWKRLVKEYVVRSTYVGDRGRNGSKKSAKNFSIIALLFLKKSTDEICLFRKQSKGSNFT
jgi:hypothetical protein